MTSTSCAGCRNASADAFAIPFTMAFQPIVDLEKRRIWGYEALVRGKAGEGAGQVLAQVSDANRYAFDQACRVKAVELAGRAVAQGDTKLSINFMPNAVYEPKACIRATLEAAERMQFDPHRLMFEFTENEKMIDADHTAHIIKEYRRMGFTTAIDDFGAGYAGLALLARFQTDLIKLDMELIRGIDSSRTKQVIVRGLVEIARQLGLIVLAEGVETAAELATLKTFGIDLYQGYYFARPRVEGFDTFEQLLAA